MGFSNSIRRHKKRLAIFVNLPKHKQRETAAQWLAEKQVVARRRAQSLREPEAWKLAPDPRVQAEAHTLDPSGELFEELLRIIAEAVAEAAKLRVKGSSTRTNEKLRR